MQIIGHRGAKGYSAENTLASFQKAIELNVDGIELDVHLSLDKEIVVIHDESLDRTTNQSGPVNNFSLKELETLGIPSLVSVFDHVRRKCFINIELKTYETATKVVCLIEHYISDKKWDYADFIVSSFDWNALKQVHVLNDNVRIGVLTSTDLDLALAFAKYISAYAIHPYYHLLTVEKSQMIKEKGFKIYPWTVNEPEDIIFVKSLHVDGIITDFPDRI
jgi:glycerophosphoryl diester phosphodiesterase